MTRKSTAGLKQTIRSNLCLGNRNRAGMISLPGTNRRTTRKEKEELPDKLNSDYVFSLTHLSLLIDMTKGRSDPVAMAKQELAGRGIDDKRQ